MTRHCNCGRPHTRYRAWCVRNHACDGANVDVTGGTWARQRRTAHQPASHNGNKCATSRRENTSVAHIRTDTPLPPEHDFLKHSAARTGKRQNSSAPEGRAEVKHPASSPTWAERWKRGVARMVRAAAAGTPVEAVAEAHVPPEFVLDHAIRVVESLTSWWAVWTTCGAGGGQDPAESVCLPGQLQPGVASRA